MKRGIFGMVCLFSVLLLAASPAGAARNPYQSLMDSLGEASAKSVTGESLDDAIARIYASDGLDFLLGNKEVYDLAGYSDEEITDVTFSDPMPCFVDKTVPEKGTDGFLNCLKNQKDYSVLVYHKDDPIAVMQVQDRGKGYKFQQIMGSEGAMAVQKAAYPNGKTEKVPLYFMVTVQDFILRPDYTVAEIFPLPTVKSAVYTFDELSDAVQIYYDYAKEHPNTMGGGLDLAAVAQQRSAARAQWFWLGLCGGCLLSAGACALYLIVRHKKRKAE